MKILCVADKRDPIVYSHSIKERFKDVDLVLSAGDLDLEYYGYIVSSTNKPLLFVFGNHNLSKLPRYNKKFGEEYNFDNDDVLAPSYGSTYIGGKVKQINGLLVAGLGGSRRYNRGLNQHSELGMHFLIWKMAPRLIWNRLLHGRYLDILLTHAAPRGLGDEPDPCHLGFKAFLHFMKWFKPSFLVHGHIHLYGINDRREYRYLDTTIINAYNHVVIDVENANSIPKVRKRVRIRSHQ